MYINPVIFGVLCTLGLEIAAMFAYALYKANRGDKK